MTLDRIPLLSRVSRQDINWTSEMFLEPGVKQHYFIVSQRARHVLQAHKARGDFEFEPVVVLP